MGVKQFFSCVKSKQRWKTQGQFCWVYRLILVLTLKILRSEFCYCKTVASCKTMHSFGWKGFFFQMYYVEYLQRTLSSNVEQFWNLFILWALPFLVRPTVVVYGVFNGRWLLLCCCVDAFKVRGSLFNYYAWSKVDGAWKVANWILFHVIIPP